MIYPTTEEEKRAFYQEVLPGFLEYLRSHMSAIEQVELATVTDGIVSFPATQVLGGVQKTVRVPLSIITAVIDADLEQVKEASRYAQEQGDYAKAEGDYADEQGDYASEQGDYAKEQGNAALAAKNIVTTWYNPFRDNVEQWAADATSAENQRIAAENTRKSQETARQNAETARASAETARANAETQRNLAELDRIEAELERISKELERKAAEAQRQQNEEVRLNGTFRQNTESGKWERLNQRTGVWEDTGNFWLGGMMAYRFYTDPATGRIHVVRNNADRMTFSLENGRLKAHYVE